MSDGNQSERPINPPPIKDIPVIDPETGKARDFQERVVKAWEGRTFGDERIEIITTVPPRELDKKAVELGLNAGTDEDPLIIEKRRKEKEAADVLAGIGDSGFQTSNSKPAKPETPLEVRLRQMKEHITNK